MLDTAKELGLDRTKLEVDTKSKAVKLYESLAFIIEETEKSFYDNGSVNLCRHFMTNITREI